VWLTWHDVVSRQTKSSPALDTSSNPTEESEETRQAEDLIAKLVTSAPIETRTRRRGVPTNPNISISFFIFYISI
jgi:hypothetical protein